MVGDLERRRHVMGDDDGCHEEASAHFVDQAVDYAGRRSGSSRDVGLIVHEDFRFGDQRPRKADSLCHSSRECLGKPMSRLRDSQFGQVAEHALTYLVFAELRFFTAQRERHVIEHVQ